jgi:hypothetical protein
MASPFRTAIVVLLNANVDVFAKPDVEAALGVLNDVHLVKFEFGHKNPPPHGGGIKLVAGAGFEPAIPRRGIMSQASGPSR